MLVSGINIYTESNHILPSVSIVAKYWVINILRRYFQTFSQVLLIFRSIIRYDVLASVELRVDKE